MSESLAQAETHRIARVNYPPRALSFAGVFLAIVLLAPALGFGTGSLLFAALSFLLYPHLAFLRAIHARNSKRAELANLLFDSALLGTWAALAGFNLWLSFALLSATLINSAVVGGLRQLGLAAICFLTGSLAVAAIAGINFQPTASLGVTLYIAGLSLAYLLAVGITSNTLNNRLFKAHHKLIRNSRVFNSLLGLTMINNQADDVPDLINQALNHFQRLEADHPFALLLFERERPRQLRNSSFRGLDEADWDHILIQLSGHNDSLNRDHPLTIEVPGHHLRAIPLLGQLEHARGYVITDSELAEELGKLLPLYLDQLGSALENKLLTEHLRKAAETDPLTGLYNRRYFEQQLEAAIARKQKHNGQDFCIVMLDLIGLKRINDSFGHGAGDRLLSTLASRLLSQARSADVVARIGGDEFVILCHDCRQADGVRLSERLIECCRHPTVGGGAGPLDQTIEISAGVAGSDRHPPEQVMVRADARMYAHKAAYYQEHELQR